MEADDYVPVVSGNLGRSLSRVANLSNIESGTGSERPDSFGKAGIFVSNANICYTADSL